MPYVFPKISAVANLMPSTHHMTLLFSLSTPQLIFMVTFFGYMIFIIVYKWCLDWPVLMQQGRAPPSLINVLINIVLQPGSEPEDALFSGQGQVQVGSLPGGATPPLKQRKLAK